jgi:uncharacterized integral membrane protein
MLEFADPTSSGPQWQAIATIVGAVIAASVAVYSAINSTRDRLSKAERAAKLAADLPEGSQRELLEQVGAGLAAAWALRQAAPSYLSLRLLQFGGWAVALIYFALVIGMGDAAVGPLGIVFFAIAFAGYLTALIVTHSRNARRAAWIRRESDRVREGVARNYPAEDHEGSEALAERKKERRKNRSSSASDAQPSSE